MIELDEKVSADEPDRIYIDRSEFLVALNMVPLAGKSKQNTQMVLYCESNEVVFVGAGLTLRASAKGSIHGQVRLPLSFLQRLAAYPPESNPIRLEIHADKLKMDGAAVSCTREAEKSTAIWLPVNPTLAAVLSISFQSFPRRN